MHGRHAFAIAMLAAACRGDASLGSSADASPGAGTIDARSSSGAFDGRPGGAADAGSPDASITSAGDLRFAIVGDTRPPNEDDTANYPSAIITTIWQDVAAADPMFAVSTGDYMFANPTGSEANAQLDLYLGARAQYTGTVYPALGNHECTGATASNCGAGNKDGVTKNYAAFMARMVMPLGYSDPWFVVNVNDPHGTWTAKLVFVAGNAWSQAQATWLDAALAVPTTYTFVVRHEGTDATTAPGVTPSAAIIAAHPLTLLIVGHTHTYRHYASDHEVICGNGGAPLSSGANYGYGVIDRRADGAIAFSEYDYATNALVETWAVTADGAKAP